MSAAWELTATEAAARIRAGDLTSEGLVRACLDRIAERDRDLRAWEHLDPDAALDEARARDGQEPGGPLHGVPVGVKDLIDTADLPTCYGSPIYAGNRPRRDADCVARLREAGAVVLGKTVTTEFALFHPGPTANPHDPTRTPGGSSSGSAAAVADGHVPLALGTQTAGSVVRPAGFCGIVGFKPSYGLVPTTGVKPISLSLDTVGAFGRTVEDAGLCVAVMAADPTLRPAGSGDAPRIGFARTHEWPHADASTRAALQTLAGALARDTVVDEVELPPAFAELVEAQKRIMAREAGVSLAWEWAEHAGRLSAKLLDVLDQGAAVSDAELAQARSVAERCRDLLDRVFADVDVLLAPSVVGEAPEGLDATGDPLFCRVWTLLGTPTVSVPGLRGPAGLPLGVQVIAPPGRDPDALGAARWLAARIQRDPS